MPRILIVDDSTVDRRVAGALLQKAGKYDIEYAVNGNEALARLQQVEFDLVLTDLLMPGMNGLDLVATIRLQHPHVPVVLMTSRGSEEIAARAVSEGAADYVPKRLLPRRLAEIVRRVLALSSRQYGHARLLGSMIETRSVFLLANDLLAIEALVVHLQDLTVQMGLCDPNECTRVGVALQEAMVNAVHHGNLQVGSEFRERNHQEYLALIAERSQQPPYCDRHIHVTGTLTRSEATFTIRDEGPGFNPATLPDPCDPANLEKQSGRGVYLMRSFMDEVRYDDHGRMVTLIKRRAEKAPAAAAEPAGE